MVMDTRRLRAAIFERSGIAIDEHDPIMAVLAASAEQTEEIGARLLSRTSPVRVAVAVTVAAAIFAAAGTVSGWLLAGSDSGRNAPNGCASKAIPAWLRCSARSRAGQACGLRSSGWPPYSSTATGAAPGASRTATACR
jgi:hypothetical protein